MKRMVKRKEERIEGRERLALFIAISTISDKKLRAYMLEKVNRAEEDGLTYKSVQKF